jgi:Aldehyde dehydrogenase family
MNAELVSTEPATGAVVWRGPISDVDTEVELAQAAWPEWASRPLAVRVEAVRRFANTVRTRMDALSDLIARETGKPLWEARNEVETVMAKVEISIDAYNERTAQRRIDGEMKSRQALRHKPHGVLICLTATSFPRCWPGTPWCSNRPKRRRAPARCLSIAFMRPASPPGSSASSSAGRRKARRSPRIPGSMGCCSPDRRAPA